MGIGNDIKPKKVYRYKPHHHNPYNTHSHNEHKKEEEPAKVKLESEENSRHDPEEVEELEDDFFHDYNKTKPKKVKEKKDNSGGFLFQNLNAKNITWLLLIALAIIVIYQNFDSIKGIFVTDTSIKNSNTNDEYYEGVANKNSNVTTNSNANVNSNANANINSNSSAPTATNKSDVTVKVLNGNGVAGSADEVSATLKAAGFSPAKSANARKFTYAESIIYYKTGEENAANLIKAALPNLTSTIENSDSIVGTFDVIVVVGKR